MLSVLLYNIACPSVWKKLGERVW